MTPAAGMSKWRPPRMNLATMLVLVAVVGSSAGWYAYSARVQRQTVRALRDAGATVLYDWQWDPDATSFQDNDKELAGWRRSLAERFGTDAVASVAAVSLRGIGGGSDAGATDEHIKLAGRLKSLRSLELGAFNVTEAGAAPIAGLKHLRILAINDFGGESDPGPILSQLGEDPRLERLILIVTAFDDEDIAAISRLPRLERLLIFGAARKACDADLAKLAALRRLKDLELFYTEITSEGMKSLGSMKSLESVSFFDSRIDDLAPLRQHPALKSLDLNYCPVGDEDLSALAEMPALKQFSLASGTLTDAGLALLRNAPNLEELKLQGDSITAAGLEPLAAIKALKSIQLHRSKITLEEANEFTKAHPGISLQLPSNWLGF